MNLITGLFPIGLVKDNKALYCKYLKQTQTYTYINNLLFMGGRSSQRKEIRPKSLKEKQNVQFSIKILFAIPNSLSLP